MIIISLEIKKDNGVMWEYVAYDDKSYRILARRFKDVPWDKLLRRKGKRLTSEGATNVCRIYIVYVSTSADAQAVQRRLLSTEFIDWAGVWSLDCWGCNPTSPLT